MWLVGWCRLIWRAGDGDAVAGGVVAQVCQGPQGYRGGRGGGRQGDAGGQELAGQADGVADGAAVRAEHGGDDGDGQVQVAAYQGGEQAVGEVELAVVPAAAWGPLAGPAGAVVAPLFLAGAERDVQRGSQAGQGLRVGAGQRGVAEDLLAAAPCGGGGRPGFRGGAGDGRQGVVPLAVEVVAGVGGGAAGLFPVW